MVIIRAHERLKKYDKINEISFEISLSKILEDSSESYFGWWNRWIWWIPMDGKFFSKIFQLKWNIAFPISTSFKGCFGIFKWRLWSNIWLWWHCNIWILCNDRSALREIISWTGCCSIGKGELKSIFTQKKEPKDFKSLNYSN